MPTFVFNSVDNNNRQWRGSVEADNEDEVCRIITSRGFAPVTIRRHRHTKRDDTDARFRRRFWQRTVPPADIILFTKQLATMLRAGLPLLRLLNSLHEQTPNRRLRQVIHDISEAVRTGSTLYDAISQHPQVFSPLYINMVRAGELSGTIPEVLERLIAIIEHEQKLRQDVRAAVQYPLTVLTALTVAFVVMLVYVVPQFTRIFTNANITLPLPTRICIGINDIIASHLMLLLTGAAGMVIGIVLVLRTSTGKLRRDQLLLKIPAIGTVLRKAALSRFAAIFAILIESGIPILSAIAILQDIVGNRAIARSLNTITRQLEAGDGLALPLRKTGYFPPLFTNMVAVGEESGQLDSLMHEVANHYDTEVAYAVKKMTNAIGPALTVVLTAMVGFFALAIYMPMWDLAKIAAQ